MGLPGCGAFELLEVKNLFPFCPGSSEWGMLKAETAGHHDEDNTDGAEYQI
jgi:hypothetical protein